MKTLIFWMLVLTIASVSSAQNVNIPDTAFLHDLIVWGVDTNGDSLISYDEAEAVIRLYVHRSILGGRGEISDMSGIEAFINLDTLRCSYNRISSLDVSNNANLSLLSCYGNSMTSLNVSGCTKLKDLCCGCYGTRCAGNLLTSLDLSNNTALTHLDCSSNELTSLDLSNNTALEYLDCRANGMTNLDISGCTKLKHLKCGVADMIIGETNQLTSLDVYNNTALTRLDCSNNELTSLDLSNNTALTRLDCAGNRLTNLNVSNNTALGKLYCAGNRLTSLDISNNIALDFLDLSNMPTLHKVCVWEMPISNAITFIKTEGSPNVQFTTDCSATDLKSYKKISSIEIYPYPSDDIINIEIENSDNATIEIYNVSGRLVFSKELNSKVEKINISGLSEGMYFVKVRQENNVKIEKLIVY